MKFLKRIKKDTGYVLVFLNETTNKKMYVHENSFTTEQDLISELTSFNDPRMTNTVINNILTQKNIVNFVDKKNDLINKSINKSKISDLISNIDF